MRSSQDGLCWQKVQPVSLQGTINANAAAWRCDRVRLQSSCIKPEAPAAIYVAAQLPAHRPDRSQTLDVLVMARNTVRNPVPAGSAASLSARAQGVVLLQLDCQMPLEI